MRVSRKITALIKTGGKRFGMNITRVEHTLEFKRQRVIDALAIDVVLDVGANDGAYGQELRRNGFGGKIISFEPIAEVFGRLRQAASGDALWTCHHLALGDAPSQAAINVAHNFASSSLLEVTGLSTAAQEETATRRRETIRIETLDALRPTLLSVGERVYMKVDVQGFEKQVLAGAAATLDQIAAVEIELSLVELYAQQTLMPEMLAHLTALGFSPVWLDRGFEDPTTGYLLQMDGIFIRNHLRR